jgi:hypothetical protein
VEKELLKEYISMKFPKEIYGDFTLDQYLTVYDSFGYRAYALSKSLEQLKAAILSSFRERKL